MAERSKGLQSYRLASNPEEKRFAEAWAALLNAYDGQFLNYLLYTGNQPALYAPPAAERDQVVAAAVIQWLGSPVGLSFLRELGYEKGQSNG